MESVEKNAGHKEVEPLRDLSDAEDFFNSTVEPALMGSKCMQCEALMLGGRTACSTCLSRSIESVRLAREGVVYSCTRVHVMQSREGPVDLAYIDLADGVRTLAELRSDEAENIGRAVILDFDADGWWFRPATEGATA
ncbi:Zn-ribbon domain-containing OB-fold protein [Pararhizobium haloflavum]|uniref:Zn-ribbon domain-containing OB-fold protein n=1 Tax=Pararhizobium haloflavum TaxID=2037914 RepID=UPI001FE14B62|nr:OB-fold domain-containing protein [Pararhizobium haloflavum]